MSKIDSLYSAINYYNNPMQKQQRKEKNEKAEATEKTDQTNQVKLSDKAQAVLDRLKEKYGNMDFMVADFRNDDEAKSILSRGTKDFSVLLSPDELEKMANDSEYEQQVMNHIDDTVKMSEEINEKFGFESAETEDAEKEEITRFGVSFNDDGTISYFAELEKAATKRTTVKASSMDELFEMIKNIDWDKVKDEKKAIGDKIDFSV